MINYGSLNRPPRRGGGRVAKAVLAAVLAVAGLGLLVTSHLVTFGAGGTPAAAAHAPTRAAQARLAGTRPAPATRPARLLRLGACIDPTRSIIPAFARTIRADLASAVAGLAPPAAPLPTSTASGRGPVTAPQPGVNLTVRQVTTDSYATILSMYTRTVTVPGVPGLASSQPPASAPDYPARLRLWTAGYDKVAAARAAARHAALAGAADITSMPLDRRGLSGISACVSGLLATAPPGGFHSYLLASDLQENVAPQLKGSFGGSPLVVIQTCDSGNAAVCSRLLRRFTRQMSRLHVGTITAVRPELAAAAINQWIRTGEVTQ